jgi:transposase-like protein
VDGIAERLHLGQPREAVLAAWGIVADGSKVLVHLAPGTKEDTASCRAFFHDMRRRGLCDPLLVVSDGAPVLIRAVEECFPRSARQRCLVHKMRNLRCKMPEDIWPEFKAPLTWKLLTVSEARRRKPVLYAHIFSKAPDGTILVCFSKPFENHSSGGCRHA